MEEIEIRQVTEDDAEALLEIYRYYVERTAVTFECTVPSVAEFRDRIREITSFYPYIAAVRDGRIIGYSYAHAFVGREAYRWSVETTIYLAADERGHGTGKKLYQALEELLRKMHILTLDACIGRPHGADPYLTDKSAGFHSHMGYNLIGTFPDSGYKFGRWYDMVWMEKVLGAHTPDPLPVVSCSDITDF